MAEFLTGCTHFGHKNIIKLAGRPFASLEEMDEVLIENWNKVVKTSDIVYHLGDFEWTKNKGRTPYWESEPYMEKLNGNIVRINGNHDPVDWGVPYMEIKRDKRLICLMHYPLEEWNAWYRGALHFHAHTHAKEFVSAERRGNVGVDANDFFPVRLEAAMERLLNDHLS